MKANKGEKDLNILLAADGRSLQAARYAGDLARSRPGSSITVLHITSPDEPVPPVGATDAVLAEVKMALELPPAQVHTARVVAHDPAPAICTFAESGAFNLIVVGVHEYSPLAALIGAGVCTKVVRRAQCPVLVVRGGVKSAS